MFPYLLQLAERMLEIAHQLCPTDPQACHEMGVLAYKAGQYTNAVTWLRRALHLAPKVQVGTAGGVSFELQGTQVVM
jgi:Flp pilus assembly protein TadD